MICVSRYKQCHFRAGHGFVFKLDANNNRALCERGDTSARFIAGSTKLHAQSTCRPTSPSFRARLCALLQTLGNVNEVDALATRFLLVKYFLIFPRFLEAVKYKRDRNIRRDLS